MRKTQPKSLAPGWFHRLCGFPAARALPLAWTQWLGSHAQLKHVLERLDINCVLDVGANEGLFGLDLRGLGYQGWIVSFEPVHDVFRKLELVAAKNQPWRVFPYALGATNERRTINIYQMHLLSSFLLPRRDSLERFPENRIVGTQEVDMFRLDSIVDECLAGIDSPRVYLKIDTQGFDLEVMKGAEATLKRVRALQTEVSFRNIYLDMPSFTDSIREFSARGFDIVGFTPVTFDLDELSAVEMDCIMTRRSSPATATEIHLACESLRAE